MYDLSECEKRNGCVFIKRPKKEEEKTAFNWNKKKKMNFNAF